ncbi:MAG TPA: response regulator transcription factor [Bacteroidota bacterium]|nr:response regulator transcription factor [Bacteroidota bacterium]
MSSSILLVEDEPEMQRGLKDNLEFEGYSIDVVGDGKDGLRKMIHRDYDLVLLDVMLPGMSGFDVCKSAREKGVRSPIIMLTAKGEEVDKVLGLELGADDYITKPFSLRELLARIKAVLRRKEGAPETAGKTKIGNVDIDFTTYTAARKGKAIDMTPKECDILRFLWQHKNQVVSRDALLTNVWGYDDSINSRTVDNFILKLRQKIEPSPSKPKHLITIHGAGYKLIP